MRKKESDMNKCLKITFSSVNMPKNFLRAFVQKAARRLELEGFAQMIGSEGKVKIIVSGAKNSVEDFLDILHKEVIRFLREEIEVEPFVKDKDYRNVFRVIE